MEGYDSESDVRTEISEKVWNVDKSNKRLTGRSVERLEDETGLTREQLFPEDKKILYVGDPWQRMGKEIDESRMTIIDYEFGEEATFMREREFFLPYLPSELTNLVNNIEFSKDRIPPENWQWLEELQKKFRELEENIGRPRDLDLNKYPEFADEFKDILLQIENLSSTQEDSFVNDLGEATDKESELDNTKRELWYKCTELERGFRDLYDWETIIVPKLNRRQEELANMGKTQNEIEDELESWANSYIREIRNYKKTKESNVVQAMFPQLPFADESFDRFVASWSISAHVFKTFDKERFDVTWAEIDRVLKSNGEAYIFPFDYESIDNKTMEASLTGVKGIHWEYLNRDGKPVDNYEAAFTLHVKKLGV